MRLLMTEHALTPVLPAATPWQQPPAMRLKEHHAMGRGRKDLPPFEISMVKSELLQSEDTIIERAHIKTARSILFLSGSAVYL